MSEARTVQIELKVQSLGATSPTYTEEWAETDLYCPFCGRQGMWQESGDGDYYTGPVSLCPACGGQVSGLTPSGAANADGPRLETLDAIEDQRLAAIRTVVF